MPEDKPTHVDLFSGIPPADSLSLRNGRDSEPSPSAKSTSIVRKSSPKTFWPSPATRDHHAQGANHNPKACSSSLATVIQKLSPTSSTSTEQPTEAATLSQADFLANLSVLPGSDEARQMTVRSGRRCGALLLKQDPLGSLQRMFLESSRWNSTTCYLTWKESATPQGRLLFRLVPSMPGTDETDCGSLEETFPTATGRDWKDGTAQACANVQVNSLLGRAIHQYPTPTAPGKHQVGVISERGGSGNPLRCPETMTLAGGSLNPTWVEWLQGFPLGWTEIE